MGDLVSPVLLYLKGFLFLVCGSVAAVLLWLEHPTFRVALLLAVTIWCFARAYYFAFYVIEHYIDDSFRYSGLVAFFTHHWRRWRARTKA